MRNGTICVALLACVFAASGCISNTKYGTVVTEAVGGGAGEGEVIAKHGCPDNIVYLGTAWYNPQTGERGSIDRYLLEYRIGGGSTILGNVYAGDKFSNICYLIDQGKVQGGGWVAEGQGSIILYGKYLHPKVRAGYGGDGTPSGLPLELPKLPGLFGLGIGPF
ncbi:MAG TPA: hypothetical protein VFF73_38400 [Planctomycetota bacterium]|nr:hypothetical protein [Planctomycetota bacterium]